VKPVAVLPHGGFGEIKVEGQGAARTGVLSKLCLLPDWAVAFLAREIILPSTVVHQAREKKDY
jgi:hypothetical protein